MPSLKKQLGAEAEALVCQQMLQQGYQIEQRNWKRKVGEIDIIAVKDPCLVIVEVRSISTTFLSHPFLNIPAKKQIQISRCALAYLKERKGLLREQYSNQWAELQSILSKSKDIRFDVAGVQWRNREKQEAEIFYLENAFYSSFAF